MRFLVVGLGLLLALTSLGAQSASNAQLFTQVEGISEYRLSNGLRVLLAPDASKPTTTVNVTYMVGSRHENYGETGMAHLLEHMLFKGTPTLPGKTIVQEFARRGMEMNGSTFYDRTNYYETFAASDDNLAWALRMEADRMVHSFVARSDLDSEMTVVRNEMESGENEPGSILWERMAAAAFQWHNYGKTTIGARSDVENVKIENLQAFYRTYYQPDNATLIVTGKFDAPGTLSLIEQNFGAIPRPERKLPALYTAEPVQDGAREVSVVRVGDSNIIGALYHMPPGAHADASYAHLLSYILGDTPTGRLHKALVETKKASSVSADALSLHDPGYLMVFVSLNKEQSREVARKAMLAVLEGLKKNPITEAELRRAKTALRNEMEKALANPVTFGVGLSESVAQGDWRLYFLNRDRVEGASLADVQRVAEQYLLESNRTMGQFIPSDKPVRAPVEAVPDLGPLLANYQGQAAQAQGEEFDPSPANIEQRSLRSRLPNGMQVALLPKATRGATVHGQITLRMGSASSLKGQRELALAVANLLLRGSSKHSRQDIADRLEELKANVDISTRDGNAVVVQFDTRRKELTATLELLTEVLRQPAFVRSEFEQFRNEWITTLQEQSRQPEAVAENALRRWNNPYPQGDVRYVATFAQEVAAIKALPYAALRPFHQKFYGANFGQIALVGDFDAKSTGDLLGKLLGDWKSRTDFSRVDMPFRASLGTALTFETPDKANAVYMAKLALPLRDDAADAQALVLANRVLGGDGLKSRIADRLRQQDGISYGAGSFLQLNAYEANSSFGLYAIFAPQNLTRLKTGVAQELARLLEHGVTEQEVQDARTGILQGNLISRAQDGSLASLLAQQLFQGRTMQFVAGNEERLRATTVADVNAAIAKYLNPQQLAQVYAGDFAAAAKIPAGGK